jgi:integrase/recombinase XerD
MGNPIITIYVRHKPGCKYTGDEFTKTCRCRKHLRWSTGGKQFRKQAGTRSWSEAETAKRNLEDQLAGRIPKAPMTAARTIRTAYEDFLVAKKVKEISTEAYKKYEREILRFVVFCEHRNIFTLEALDITLLTAYKATWPKLYPSSATRALVQQLLRVFLNYCHGAGWITRVPKMDAVKIDQPPTLPLTEKEYERLLAAVPLEFTNGTAGRVRAIIQLMRWSGLAVRDASCLLRADIILHAKGKYHVRTERQKTGVHVRIPIPEAIAEEILAVGQRGSKHLFYETANGAELSFAQQCSRKISAAFTRAGIECEGHMVSHRLRDTFAVDLLSKGVPMEEVSKLLGHKSISTTERHYAQWAKVRQDRVDALVTATWKK